MTPLFLSLYNGHEDIALLLIKDGCDVTITNLKNETPLHEAARKGYLEICEYLIQSGSAVNSLSCGFSPLHFAANTDVCRILLKANAEINSQDRFGKNVTPLHRAVTSENFEVVKFLVENGADINRLDSSRKNALHYALIKNNFQITKFLLENGIDCNAICQYIHYLNKDVVH